MGRRRQPRLKGILPVRIWGVDLHGKPFAEHVCTADISGTGASLAGVSAQLSVGDIVGLQYRNRQAQFRVAWITAASKGKAPRIGIECLQPDKNLWPVTPPTEEPDHYLEPKFRLHKYESHQSNHRRHVRFPARGRVQVSKIGGGAGFSARLGDISLGGCYLQTNEPMEVGGRLTLLINTGTTELEATGVVRTHYPARAMGVEFTFMSKADRRALSRLINQLEEFQNVSP